MKRGLKNAMCTSMFIIACTMFSGCDIHYVVGSGTNFLDKEDAKEFKVEESVVDPITSISIHTGMAEIELIEADEFFVEIDYLYWAKEPEYTLEDGKLYFDDSDAFPNSYSINFDLDNTIKIYLPKKAALSDISVKSASGDVHLSGFVADEMDVAVAYGDFTLKSAAAVKADITLSSGASQISDFEAGELDFTNSYGNASFTNINTGEPLLSSDTVKDNLNITMSSGDVKINGLKTNSVTISNSYGNITCSDITAQDCDVDLSSGNLEVRKADLQDIDVSNSYGDVNLNLAGPDSEYSLDLNTSYGKVKVGNKDYDEHIILDHGGSRKVTADLSSGDVKVIFEH